MLECCGSQTRETLIDGEAHALEKVEQFGLGGRECWTNRPLLASEDAYDRKQRAIRVKSNIAYASSVDLRGAVFQLLICQVSENIGQMLK